MRLTITMGRLGVAIIRHRGRGKPHFPRLLSDEAAKTYIADLIDKERARIDALPPVPINRLDASPVKHSESAK